MIVKFYVLIISNFLVLQTEDQEVDISTKMRKRVKIGYGFDVSFNFPFSIISFSVLHSPFQPHENAKLLGDDEVLTQVWQWLKCKLHILIIIHTFLGGRGCFCPLPPLLNFGTRVH
jgi:hypothetical protein